MKSVTIAVLIVLLLCQSILISKWRGLAYTWRDLYFQLQTNYLHLRTNSHERIIIEIVPVPAVPSTNPPARLRPDL